jgi:hypothetical protein
MPEAPSIEGGPHCLGTGKSPAPYIQSGTGKSFWEGYDVQGRSPSHAEQESCLRAAGEKVYPEAGKHQS